jgi:hypothetical protein
VAGPHPAIDQQDGPGDERRVVAGQVRGGRIPGRMSPGAMQVERTAAGPASTASIFDSMMTAAFDTEYAPIPASPWTPASEETWIMQPPRAARCG